MTPQEQSAHLVPYLGFLKKKKKKKKEQGEPATSCARKQESYLD